MLRIFKMWRLEYKRAQLERNFEKSLMKFDVKKPSPYEFEELVASRHYALQDIENGIGSLKSTKLVKQAEALDVGLPPYPDDSMWDREEDGYYPWLSQKGRDHLRKQIHEEKVRRREARSWLEKIIIPLVTAIIGVGGIGWVVTHLHWR
jgi:hypothetical protein